MRSIRSSALSLLTARAALVAAACSATMMTAQAEAPDYQARYGAVVDAAEREAWAQANKLAMLLYADLAQSGERPELGIALAQLRLDIVDKLYADDCESWDKEAMASVNEQLSFYTMMTPDQYIDYMAGEAPGRAVSDVFGGSEIRPFVQISVPDACWSDYRQLVRAEAFVDATQLMTDCTVAAQGAAGLLTYEDIVAGRLPKVEPVSDAELEALGIPTDPVDMRKAILDLRARGGLDLAIED